jgi:rsbT co-antagonist protein RsbR
MTNTTPAAMTSEERYKELMEASQDLAIYFLSKTGHIESWNKGAELIKGYKAEEVVGKHLSMFYTQEDRESNLVQREIDEAARSGRFEGSGWRLRKDGTKIWVEVIISPLKDQAGQVKGFLKIARDATERKRQTELIERQKRDILELSTPVIQLWDGILALPIIGTLDSQRSQVVMERLLTAITTTGASIAILDISGVPAVDTMVAQHLMKTMDAAKLMGAECIISGIRPEIAQTMVHLGIDLSFVKTRSTMSRALEDALRTLNVVVGTRNNNNNNNADNYRNSQG